MTREIKIPEKAEVFRGELGIEAIPEILAKFLMQARG